MPTPPVCLWLPFQALPLTDSLHQTTSSTEGYDHDLFAVFASLVAYYEAHSVPWFERSFGHLFFSFDAFLSHGWPCMSSLSFFPRTLFVCC